MIKIITRNWSLIFLVIVGGIVLANNVNSQEISPNAKFQAASAPTLTFLYW